MGKKMGIFEKVLLGLSITCVAIILASTVNSLVTDEPEKKEKAKKIIMYLYIPFILFGLTAMYLSCKHRDPTKIKGKLSEAVTIEMAIFFGGCIVAFGSLFVN